MFALLNPATHGRCKPRAALAEEAGLCRSLTLVQPRAGGRARALGLLG